VCQKRRADDEETLCAIIASCIGSGQISGPNRRAAGAQQIGAGCQSSSDSRNPQTPLERTKTHTNEQKNAMNRKKTEKTFADPKKRFYPYPRRSICMRKQGVASFSPARPRLRECAPHRPKAEASKSDRGTWETLPASVAATTLLSRPARPAQRAAKPCGRELGRERDACALAISFLPRRGRCTPYGEIWRHRRSTSGTAAPGGRSSCPPLGRGPRQVAACWYTSWVVGGGAAAPLAPGVVVASCSVFIHITSPGPTAAR
jgi:hypothetical protein